MSFDCEIGSVLELEISNPLFHENTGQLEYDYYPFKICMNVSGAERVLTDKYSVECGHDWTWKVCITYKTRIYLYIMEKLIQLCKFSISLITSLCDANIDFHVNSQNMIEL